MKFRTNVQETLPEMMKDPLTVTVFWKFETRKNSSDSTENMKNEIFMILDLKKNCQAEFMQFTCLFSYIPIDEN